MRRPGTLATLVLVGAVFVAGCSGGSDGAARPAGTTAAGGPSTTLPLSVTGGVDLRRLVVTEAPAGYDLLASPPFGAVDLDRLLAQFSDAPTADRVVLEGAGFKGGYTRGWLRDTPPSFFGVFVFEFVDEEGARSARDGFAAQNVGKKDAGRFAVDTIADAIGESYSQQTGTDPPERVHQVTFVRGPRLYQVSGQFSDEAATTDDTISFAQTEDRIAG